MRKYKDTPPNPTVFVSLAHDDYAIGLKICEALECVGILSWIACRNMPCGANFAAHIPAVIRSCSVIIVIVSEASNGECRYVESELILANEYKLGIVPLLLEGAAPSDSLRFLIGSRHYLPVSSPLSDQELATLVTAVKWQKNP